MNNSNKILQNCDKLIVGFDRIYNDLGSNTTNKYQIIYNIGSMNVDMINLKELIEKEIDEKEKLRRETEMLKVELEKTLKKLEMNKGDDKE